MPRNRVIYQSEALYVGPTPSTGYQAEHSIKQIHRVQTCNYSFNIDRTDVNQFGELAAIDRIALDTPTVALDFSYLLANFENETNLGLVTDGSDTTIKNLLNKSADDKNYYIRTVGEGVDAIGDLTKGTSAATIGIGNGFMTSYSSEASVGAFPTATVNVEGLNMIFVNTISGDNPAVDPVNGSRITENAFDFTLPDASGNANTGDLSFSTLRPGDITFHFKQRDAESVDLGTGVDGARAETAYAAPGAQLGDGTNEGHGKIQSYNFSVDLPREAIMKLGSRFAFSREITFPITATLGIEALVSDLIEGSLSDLINCDDSYDITVNILRPTSCSGSGYADIFAQYKLKNAKVNSQAFSSDIGSNKTVSLEFSTQLGGPNQDSQGLFLSGISNSHLFHQQDTTARS
jgi:hypothetical protein